MFKVLLEINEWTLCEPNFGTRLKSIPVHVPCNSGCGLTAKVGFHKPQCSVCGQSVPMEIEAAYILHNWEVREESNVRTSLR